MLLPATEIAGPWLLRALAEAVAAFLAPSGDAKSTKAVPLGFPVTLSITIRQLLMRPNDSRRSCSMAAVASRGRFRINAVVGSTAPGSGQGLCAVHP